MVNYKNMSVSQEDFLKTVYHIIFDERSEATASELAKRLSISNAAVTDMARKLSAQGDITYVKYKAITLTAKGKKRAVDMIRKHRIWETFLHRVLGFSSGSVHKEAERLEHSTSDILIEKLDEYLGRPEYDPHGDPIPGREGKMPQQPGSLLLIDCDPGKYTILRLQHRSPEISSFLNENGFELNKELTVINRMKQNNSIAIKIDNRSIVLNESLAGQIHVKKK